MPERLKLCAESAVHRDLVNTGRWAQELGEKFSDLFELRLSGDYGIAFGVSQDEAESAIETMNIVLDAVSKEHPDVFVR